MNGLKSSLICTTRPFLGNFAPKNGFGGPCVVDASAPFTFGDAVDDAVPFRFGDPLCANRVSDHLQTHTRKRDSQVEKQT